MKQLLIFALGIIIIVILMQTCEARRDPYEVGNHWDYHIYCENGFVYKARQTGTIQILNSDGTPLKCGQKIY